MPGISHDATQPSRVRLLAGGELVHWHTHDQDHVVYPAAGVISVFTGQAAWILPSPSRAVFIPARMPHAHWAHSQTLLRTVLLPAKRRHLLRGTPTVCTVTPLLRELLGVLTDTPPTDSQQRARLFALVDDLLHPASAPTLVLPQPSDPRLVAVAELLATDPTARHDLTALAAAANTSPRTLTRLITCELGLTLPRWRTQLRLAHSLLLLADGQSVTTTAHQSGWRNASSYIAAFHAAFTVTPAAYQRSTKRT